MLGAIETTQALDEAKKQEALSNRCPKCGGERIASGKKESEPVFCAKCGTKIPPSDTANWEVKSAGNITGNDFVS